MSKQFGKTWWGQQWLNSLANIDYDNRLPRGSAYAGKGAVKQITIQGNVISAKVAGSRPKPYGITIVIPPFTEKETTALTQTIAAKPAIISKLLNRELDPEILTIARDMGLRVFPRQWTDFKMACNCPDWAVPCKHLAAVIYKVSAEIDNNPFLAFELHNVDLIKELEKDNVHVSTRNTAVPILRELLEGGRSGKKTTTAAKEKADDREDLRLDYSTLFPISDPLVQLLADSPVFYQNSGNFKEKYAAQLKRAERNVLRIIKGKVSLDSFIPVYGAKRNDPTDAPLIDSHTDMTIGFDSDSNVSILIGGKPSGLSLPQLMAALWQIPVNLTDNYQPSVAALHSALRLSINLLANGAVLPQIVRLDDGSYHVRWLPATICNPVKMLTEKFGRVLKRDVGLSDDSPDAAMNFLSPFISSLVTLLCGGTSNDTFLDLFFSGRAYPFRKPGEDALPGGINVWLQRYFITRGNFRPSIVVDETEEGAFRLSVEMETERNRAAGKVPLRKILTQKQYEKIRFEALQSLIHLNPFIPGLDDYINSRCLTDIILDIRDFTPFLMRAIPAIRLLDIDILLPKSLSEILRPKPSLHIGSKARDGKSFMRLDILLEYDWRVAVGDTLMDEGEFRKLLKNSDGLFKYKTNYIYVSPEEIEKLHKQFSSAKALSPLETLRIALNHEYHGAHVTLSREVETMIAELTRQPDIPMPEGLNADLRPYQRRGVSWLYRNSQMGFGSVLADDMGLGKTLQVIALLLKFQEEGAPDGGKALIVVPTGLLSNWMAEFEKFAPSLKVTLYHGTDRKLDGSAQFDVLLTSYGVARSDAASLKKIGWQVLVIDEAQNIKNHETAQSKAVKSIGAKTFIAMSGTPVENRLGELWSIMDFANRGFLGNQSEFRDVYATPIQNLNDMDAAAQLKRVTAPFMMRRLKTDKTIISDLPDKIEIDSYGYLAKEQAGLYQRTLQEAMAAIEGVEGADHRSLFVRQGLVLQMILALKQICNHPALFLKNKTEDASLSGKMDLLFEKLDTIVDANEKVLIFTQFAQMGELLKRFISDRYGETPLFYHGGCTLKQRKEMVEGFQNNRADKIFILSLKAAGTGLNLTAASHVIHYDLWWNPAVEAQATDRAYRIGQKNNVMVHRFITKGTFEERINEMIQSKKALADMTVATGENWIGNLSNTELKSLFTLSRDNSDAI